MRKNIVLCGFMGSGKSRIGRLLAGRLGVRFVDLDEYIADKENAPIADLFARNGEDWFRQREAYHLLEQVNDPERVLALGGGALQNQHLVDAVKRFNLLVFINPGFDEIIQRIAGKPKRPLVMNPDGSAKSHEELIATLKPRFEHRLIFYTQAHIDFVPEPGWDQFRSAAELNSRIDEYAFTI